MSLWPVLFGPFRRLVFGIPAELENVPLRDADVFEEHPCGMRYLFRGHAAQLGREGFNCVGELGVGFAATEQRDELLAQGLVFVGSLIVFGHLSSTVVKTGGEDALRTAGETP